MERFDSSLSGLELVGLIPAAGQAKRLGALPCSKEIFPVGFWQEEGEPTNRPKAACHYLLERMQRAGVDKVYIVLRDGKWDIPAYLGDGHELGVHLAYLMMRLPHGPPYTLDQAYSFVRDALVVTGFPDLLFEPQDAFVHLLEKQTATGADVVLGLFPTHRPHKMDMVEVDARGRVRGIEIKPAQTQLRYTWIIAVWTPAFTEFLHTYLQQTQKSDDVKHAYRQEVHVGDVIQAALQANLYVDSVEFPNGSCLDIGTSDDLATAIKQGGDLVNLHGVNSE